MKFDYYWTLYAASCFFCYFLGSRLGGLAGFDLGKKYMKDLIVKDMKIYPTKWKWYLERFENERNGID